MGEGGEQAVPSLPPPRFGTQFYKERTRPFIIGVRGWVLARVDKEETYKMFSESHAPGIQNLTVGVALSASILYCDLLAKSRSHLSVHEGSCIKVMKRLYS